MKDHYAKAVRSLSFTKKNFVVTKREFSKVLKSPFEKAFLIPNIKAGFAKTGIYPLNRDAVAKSKMKPSLVHGSSLLSSPFTSADSDSTPLPSSSSSAPPTPSSTPTSTPASRISSPSDADRPPDTTSPISHLVSTSSSSVVSTPTSRPPGIVNPLVAAGLISPDLMDILVAPAEDDAVSKKRTKRITGARDLTSEGYTEMLREEKKRKVAVEEEKRRKKEEREQKKKEREQEKERKKLEREKAGRGRGRGRGGCARGSGGRGSRAHEKSPTPTSGRRLNLESSSESDDGAGPAASPDSPQNDPPNDSSQSDMDTDNDDAGPSTGRPHHQRTMPSRYRQDSSSDDQNDGTLCILCNSNEPKGLSASVVFWIDCDRCGAWAHNVCAFGNNTASRQYLCPKCSTD